MPPRPDADPSRPPGPPADHERVGTRDVADWRTTSGRRLAAHVVRQAARLAPILRWSAANLALVVTAVVGGFGVLLLDLGAAVVYESVAENDGLAALDRPVLDQAVAWRSPGLDTAVTVFTDLGGPVGMPILAAGLTLAIAWLWRRWTPVVLMLIAATGSLALTALGKDLIGRARPPVGLAVPPLETSPSFPSGHTLNATVVMGLAAYLLLVHWSNRRARVATVLLAGAFALAMGLSRVFLGHHWLTDVVAGWLLGLGWVVAVVTAHRLWVTVRRREAGSVPSAGRPRRGGGG